MVGRLIPDLQGGEITSITANDQVVVRDPEASGFKTGWARVSSLAQYLGANISGVTIDQVTGLQSALNGKQPLDAGLTSISGLVGAGFVEALSGDSYQLTAFTGTGNVVRANSPTLVTPALGTPASGVMTNVTGLPVGTGISGLGSGVAAFLAGPSSANLATAVTDETGSGSLVFGTSPTLVTPNLGTPSAATLTNATGLPVASGISGLATGIATFLATPTSANLAAAVTNETGSGALVFATSPTLVTPALGTPASGVMTNVTGTAAGLTAGNVTTNANLTGQVTSSGNAATVDKTAITAQTLNNSPVPANDYILYYSASNNALQKATITNLISAGTAGVTTFNGRSGTVVPASADYTVAQVTGAAPTASPTFTGTVTLPAAPFTVNATAVTTTGAQFNYLNAATGTTGTASSNLVFSTSPTLVTPALGTPSSGTLTNCTGLPIAGLVASTSAPVGVGTIELGAASDTTISRDSAGVIAVEGVPLYSNIPQNSKSAAYTTVLSDAQKHIFHPSADTTARVWTIDSNANVPYPVGTAITFVNQNAGGVITIAITADTMRLAGAGTTGSRALAANGVATALKVTSTEWIISGTGLT